MELSSGAKTWASQSSCEPSLALPAVTLGNPSAPLQLRVIIPEMVKDATFSGGDNVVRSQQVLRAPGSPPAA